MTRDELKQKLEAIREGRSHGQLSAYEFENGVNLILPLLLDAYEALEFYNNPSELAKECKGYCPEFSDVALKVIARIEAFANGEKLPTAEEYFSQFKSDSKDVVMPKSRKDIEGKE